MGIVEIVLVLAVGMAWGVLATHCVRRRRRPQPELPAGRMVAAYTAAEPVRHVKGVTSDCTPASERECIGCNWIRRELGVDSIPRDCKRCAALRQAGTREVRPC